VPPERPPGPPAPDRVDLVDEQDARRAAAGLCEQLADLLIGSVVVIQPRVEYHACTTIIYIHNIIIFI
jgi:hypothetical protein